MWPSVSLGRTRRSLLPHQIATSSIQIMQRRGYATYFTGTAPLTKDCCFSRAWSPVEWFQRTLSPQIREQDNKKEVEEARERARASGEASVFDYEEPLPTKVEGKEILQESLKPKPSEVRCKLRSCSFNWKLVLIHNCSTVGLQVTSRYRIAN